MFFVQRFFEKNVQSMNCSYAWNKMINGLKIAYNIYNFAFLLYR